MSVRAPEVANRIMLDENEMPTRWYNIQADLPFPGSPPLHPGTRQPIGPQDLAPLFPMELIKQEVSQERYIDIPQPVQEALRLWRPTPLMRATRLERELRARHESSERARRHAQAKRDAERAAAVRELRSIEIELSAVAPDAIALLGGFESWRQAPDKWLAEPAAAQQAA